MSEDRKFCTSCSLTKPAIGGETVYGVRKRWRCAQCKAKVATRNSLNKKDKEEK